MKPEETAEIILWDWLKTKSKYVEEIYFNRINKLNGIFTVKGTQGRKPDFVIKINRNFGVEYIAIEIKNANKSKDVYDAHKILDYYEEYFMGKAKYYINNKEIKINHFAIATNNSIKGYLLRKENQLLDNMDAGDDNEEYKRYMVECGNFPRYEYYTTSIYLRLLWSNWRRLAKKCTVKKKWTGIKAPSIGIIISNPNIDKFPYFFTMVYVDWLNKKNRWGQRWWKI